VGCAVLLENGEIYSGNNQENAAFPSGLCAERTTLFWVAANFPDVKVKKIFVVGGPKEFMKKSSDSSLWSMPTELNRVRNQAG
jgi:cytidine deaminase